MRLRESSVADTTSTRDRATWTATNPRPPIRRGAAVRDFKRVPGSAAPALQAGHIPKNSVVATARAAVTRKTVWSGWSDIAVPMFGWRKNGKSEPVPYHASAAPSAAPATAMTKLSARYWRTSLSRPAPMAVRTANSCWRSCSFDIMSPLTFTQHRRSTMTTRPCIR